MRKMAEKFIVNDDKLFYLSRKDKQVYYLYSISY